MQYSNRFGFMEILKYSGIDLSQVVKRSEQDIENVVDTVYDIIDNVKIYKDDALIQYNEKFDGVKLDELKVSQKEIDNAYEYFKELCLYIELWFFL